MTNLCYFLAESLLFSERIQHGGKRETGRNHISKALALYGINYYFCARKTDSS